MAIRTFLTSFGLNQLFMLQDNTLDAGSTGQSTTLSTETGGFTGAPICEGVTASYRSNSNTSFTSASNGAVIANTSDINEGSGIFSRRCVFLWSSVQSLDAPSCIFEQGGGLNNLAILSGLGGAITAQAADTGTPFLIAPSLQGMVVNRPYFIAMIWERSTVHPGSANRVGLVVNGVLQNITEIAGNTAEFPGHNGNIVVGNSADPLKSYGETTLPLPQRRKFANMLGFINDSAQFTLESTAVPNLREIFERSTLAEVNIAADTVANQQAALDTLGDTNFGDVNLALRIYQATDATDYTLTLPNLTFTENLSLENIGIQYVGPNTLTLLANPEAAAFRVSTPAEVESNGVVYPGGGTIVFDILSTLTLNGIPDVPNAILYVEDVTNSVVTFPTLVSGAATINTRSSNSYRVRADAPGYTASSFINLSGSVPEFTFDLESHIDLYNSGTDRSSQILFNPLTFEVTITDETANLSFADVYHTLENYLSSTMGILLSFPPVPVEVSLGGSNVRNYLFFPYDTNLGQVNPVKIVPDPTNTLDPTFTDFVVILEQATAPLFDIFDFTSAGGRSIRFQTDSVAGGITSQQAQQLVDILANTARVNALIEDSSGDRFTAKALEKAPTSSGGSGGGDSAEDIYNYFIDLTRADAFKADVSNLDVAVSSRLADSNYTAPLTSVNTQAAVQDALTSQGFTTVRSTYLDALNITGTLANSDNASLFQATGFSTLTATQVRSELSPELALIDASISSRLPSAAYVLPLTTGKVQDALTTQGYTASRAGYLDALNVTGTLANSDNAALFQGGTSSLTPEDIRTELSPELALIDASISSRLPSSSYVIPLDTAGIQSAIIAALSSQGYTTNRASYLDALNITGTLANSDNASLFQATGFSTLTAAQIRTELTSELEAIEALVKGDYIITQAGIATLYDEQDNPIATHELLDFAGQVADPSRDVIASRRAV